MDFIFYISLLFFIFIFGSLDINIDYDFWARIIIGKSFFQTGSLFHNDFYSFGKTHEFIDHEWGSSIIFYLIQDNFGDIGLFIFKSLIIFLTFLVIIKTIKFRKKDIKLHILLFFLAIHAISYNIFSTIRCQTFSFLFFVSYIYILEYIRKTENYRILWVLPILNIIWLNLHGGFVLGIALIFIYSICEFLDKKPIKPHLITLAATLISCLINPYGIKYIIYIFNAILLNRVHIPEWQSAFFNHDYIFNLLKFKMFFFVFILLFSAYIIKVLIKKDIKNYIKNIDKTKYFVLIFSLLIAMKSIRCHPFFVYSVLIFCYENFDNYFNKNKLLINVNKSIDIILFVLITVSAASHLYNYKFVNQVNENFYPVGSIEFIKENELKGNVFTNFHTGSYAAYKLYPNNHIYMDGRYEEVYDNSLINNMGKFFLAEDYHEFLNHNHFDILIMDKTYPKIIEKLKSDNNWFLAYDEKAFSLFLPIKYKNHNFKLPINNQVLFNRNKFETNIDWIN